jgi:hypothetical protein
LKNTCWLNGCEHFPRRLFVEWQEEQEVLFVTLLAPGLFADTHLCTCGEKIDLCSITEPEQQGFSHSLWIGPASYEISAEEVEHLLKHFAAIGLKKELAEFATATDAPPKAVLQ